MLHIVVVILALLVGDVAFGQIFNQAFNRRVSSAEPSPVRILNSNTASQGSCETDSDCEFDDGQVGATDGPEATTGDVGMDADCTPSTCDFEVPPTLPSGVTEVWAFKDTGTNVTVEWDFLDTGTTGTFWLAFQFAHDETSTATGDVFFGVSNGSYDPNSDVRCQFDSGADDFIECKTDSGTSGNTGSGSIFADTWYGLIFEINSNDDTVKLWVDQATTGTADLDLDGTGTEGAIDRLALMDHLGTTHPVWIGPVCYFDTDPVSASNCPGF